jgi:hypothetical protein
MQAGFGAEKCLIGDDVARSPRSFAKRVRNFRWWSRRMDATEGPCNAGRRLGAWRPMLLCGMHCTTSVKHGGSPSADSLKRLRDGIPSPGSLYLETVEGRLNEADRRAICGDATGRVDNESVKL